MRQWVVTKGDATLFQQHASFLAQGTAMQIMLPRWDFVFSNSKAHPVLKRLKNISKSSLQDTGTSQGTLNQHLFAIHAFSPPVAAILGRDGDVCSQEKLLFTAIHHH